MKRLSSALEGFYASKITMPSLEKESAFVWSVYKKSQQLCYSFAMELLLSISDGNLSGREPAPSQKELAEQRGRFGNVRPAALGLLGCVGAVSPRNMWEHVSFLLKKLRKTAISPTLFSPETCGYDGELSDPGAVLQRDVCAHTFLS